MVVIIDSSFIDLMIVAATGLIISIFMPQQSHLASKMLSYNLNSVLNLEIFSIATVGTGVLTIKESSKLQLLFDFVSLQECAFSHIQVTKPSNDFVSQKQWCLICSSNQHYCVRTKICPAISCFPTYFLLLVTIFLNIR